MNQNPGEEDSRKVVEVSGTPSAVLSSWHDNCLLHPYPAPSGCVPP